jgi:hypothetical protein
MYGYILDFYWNTNVDPVKVSVIAQTLASVDSIFSINPINFDGTWPRSQIAPVHQKTVTNQQTGLSLSGHVCQIAS